MLGLTVVERIGGVALRRSSARRLGARRSAAPGVGLRGPGEALLEEPLAPLRDDISTATQPGSDLALMVAIARMDAQLWRRSATRQLVVVLALGVARAVRSRECLGDDSHLRRQLATDAALFVDAQADACGGQELSVWRALQPEPSRRGAPSTDSRCWRADVWSWRRRTAMSTN